MIVVEWVFFAFFSVDYCLRLFVAESRVVFLLSKESIIDILSILPIITVASTGGIG